jgi:hypothetical protein
MKTKMDLVVEKINNLTSKYPAQCLFSAGFIFGFIIGSIF